MSDADHYKDGARKSLRILKHLAVMFQPSTCQIDSSTLAQ
jgi:hypothetical protein